VDYAGLKEQRGYLDDLVTYLERLDPRQYRRVADARKDGALDQRLNALTLRAVIDNYPIVPAIPNGSYPANSLKQIHGVWDFNRVKVMGQELTLGYIETKILRRDFMTRAFTWPSRTRPSRRPRCAMSRTKARSSTPSSTTRRAGFSPTHASFGSTAARAK
jgi:hypothetical protein